MKYWMKTIGTSGSKPCDKGYARDYVDFARRPRRMRPGDFMVLYAVGGSNRGIDRFHCVTRTTHMKTASVADVKANVSEYLNDSAKGPILVTRNGKAVAMLVAVQEDDDIERLTMAHSPKLRAILDAARKRIQDGKGIPNNEFWEQLEKNNVADKRTSKGGNGSQRKRSKTSQLRQRT